MAANDGLWDLDIVLNCLHLEYASGQPVGNQFFRVQITAFGQGASPVDSQGSGGPVPSKVPWFARQWPGG